MSYTLISVSRLDQAGYSLEIGGGVCVIHSPKPASKKTLTLLEFHHLLGHINFDVCINMLKNRLAEDMPEVTIPNERPFCSICAKAKAVRRPFPKESYTEYKSYGDKVVSDLWGPASVQSL
ncbi:hypothetical protein GYMLUDRAFT_114464, partial [Collybiopsis luxurians FD-317 M1]